MAATGFWWVLLSVILYGILHSILAANPIKARLERWIGKAHYQRFYRLFFAITGGVTFLPSLALAALLPDQVIYIIPTPWKYLTLLVQLAALGGLAAGVLQTGALAFLGIAQAFSIPAPEKLLTSGLYRWVRHPLYTCALLFLWLAPIMTWNLLALNLGVTAYLWIGSIFEERKLAAQFGQEYEEYRRRTPRIIPGINI